MDKIRVHFVLPKNCSDSSQVSEVMSTAFESCKQNSLNVSWIEEAKINCVDFVKTDFVVFETFEGEQFEAMKESKCARVVGPYCILICLTDGNPIPNFTWPIYNVAMAGCVVTCSHLPKATKQLIKERVRLMGGCYTDSLMSTNTHLVTGSVQTEKYMQAAESGVKLMIPTWVDAVWEASQNKKVHCNDEQFTTYRCLPFYNLTICSTGFPTKEMRTEVAQIVNKNGGTFTTTLVVTKTDVLIVYGESGLSSEKYIATRKNPNLHCVNVEWIHDSVAKGYALPHHLYNLRKFTSTPTKPDETCPNFSMVSAIGDFNDRHKTRIEESTIQKDLHVSSMPGAKISPNKRKCSNGDEVSEIIDGLDIKKAKRAGLYLDGCNVYVAGFKPEQREKLCKILNLSGATRYDDISDRLTHIIVGDPNCPEMKIIKSKNYDISLVSIQWLLASMKQQQAVDEEDYLIRLHNSEKEQFSSPLGRKGLTLLRSRKTLTSNDLEATNSTSETLKEPEIEKDLMQQYLRSASQSEETDTLAQLLKGDSNFNSRPDMSVQSSDKSTAEYSDIEDEEKSTENVNIFYSKKFVISGFSVEDYHYFEEAIKRGFGTVMSKTYKGIPDFVVAPMFIRSPIQISALEIVNNSWIEESLQVGEECPFSYYHRPMLVPSTKPLENTVVTISGYTAYERSFLKGLIEELGGTCQEQFARIRCEEKNILPSTHLVSLEADGKKYKAALKWGLPVINKEWLLQCARSGKLENVDDFLVGEAKSASAVDGTGSCVEPSKMTKESAKSKRVLTPLNQKQPLDINKTEHTPMAQRLFRGVIDTPDPSSQVTPVNKFMEEVRRTNLLGSPQTPVTVKDIDTPESPFGVFIRPHLSPKSKKELARFINSFPDYVPPPPGRKSTPLSEVKRRCWKKILGTQNESPTAMPSTSQVEKDTNKEQEGGSTNDNSEDVTQNAFINTRLKQIEEMVNAQRGSRRGSGAFQSTVPHIVGSATMKVSQPFTVGWDYNESMPKKEVRIFMLSGVEKDARQAIVDQIESLGGQVTELSSFDPKATHLLCPLPARNEKALGCMAAGKWILHISYVAKSVAAGKFLDEEDFEFGNPKSKNNIKSNFDAETEAKLHSAHWWRKEIGRRGYGAFNDMRAIVIAQKREPLMRVIEAGGGQIVDAKPPFNETVHATHCLMEVKSVPDFSVYNPLAEQGILCMNTFYISDYLFKTNKDIKEAILPHFSRFYS